MSLYFFNVADGRSEPGDTGTEIATLEDAKLEAIRLAGCLMRDDPEHFVGCAWALDVQDVDGLKLFGFSLSANGSSTVWTAPDVAPERG